MSVKKTIASVIVVIAALFTLSIAEAASPLEKWADSIKSKYAGTAIRVLGIPHPASDALRALTPEFEKATGIKVSWELVGSGDIMSKQFLAQTAKDVPYDVYMTKGVYLPAYETRHVLADLRGFLNNSALTPPGYDYEDITLAYREGLGVFRGKVRGIPIAGESFFISYRKDLFDKYGKSPPDTTEELLELAKFFQNKEPGLYGISMRAETGRTFALAWDLFTSGFGGAIIDQKTWEVKVNTPETLASLKYFLELLQYAPPDIETFSWNSAISAFTSGKTAMWYDATSLQPWIDDPKKSKVVGKVAYAPPPRAPKGRFGPVGGWDLSVPSLAKNKEAGWAYIAWMTSRAKAKELIDAGGIPARFSTLNDPDYIAKNPNFVKALKEALKASGNLISIGQRWIPATPEGKKIHKIAGYYGGQALLKKMTPEEAVKAAETELLELSKKIKATKF